MKKPKNKYLVSFSESLFCETWAVSEKQAINNAKFQLGLAGTYEYHEYNPAKVELLYKEKESEE